MGRLPGRCHHRGRRPVAQAEARAAEPGRPAVPDRRAGRPERPLEVRADRLRAGEPARDVVADMGDHGRPRLGREQGVERRDAIGLGRRDGQATAHVVEAGLADPADPGLEGVQGRQEL